MSKRVRFDVSVFDVANGVSLRLFMLRTGGHQKRLYRLLYSVMVRKIRVIEPHHIDNADIVLGT